MTLIKFEVPVLWKPANANGVAAHISGTMDEKPFAVNLYWSGLLLATHKELDEKALLAQAVGFQKNYIPRDEKAIALHYEYNGEDFVPIVDPHWVPGTKSF